MSGEFVSIYWRQYYKHLAQKGLASALLEGVSVSSAMQGPYIACRHKGNTVRRYETLRKYWKEQGEAGPATPHAPAA